MERLEILVGLEVGVIFRQREQVFERTRQACLGCCSRCRTARTDGRVPRRNHRIERRLFMRGITLHSTNEVRNKVVPLAQLSVDVGPALPHILAQADQSVVNNNRDQAEHNDGDDNPQAHLLYSPSNGR